MVELKAASGVLSGNPLIQIILAREWKKKLSSLFWADESSGPLKTAVVNLHVNLFKLKVKCN